MKKLFSLFVMFVIGMMNIFAQGIEQLPLDPAVRIGVLDNGMTYYIRHNEKPKGQASFYIYHDVGAVQEDDDQQGLAHFLEHMAFNGTKKSPRQGDDRAFGGCRSSVRSKPQCCDIVGLYKV